MRDVLQKITKALPAAGASATSDTIDLGPNGGLHLTGAQLELELPALPSLVDAKTVTLTVRDSADDSTFADVAGYGGMVVTGAGGVGAGAKTWLLRFHNHVRRYVRIKIDVLAAGGDNTAKSLTAAVVWP